MFGYIYKTTNLITKKIYIGKHISAIFDPAYIGSGTIFLKSLKKHGKENFECVLIEAVDTEEELNTREKFWIAELNARDPKIGYNINEGGEGNPGYKHAESCKVALSEKKKKYRWYHKGDQYTTIPEGTEIPEGYIPGKPPISQITKDKIAKTIKAKQLKAYKSESEKKTIYLSPTDTIPVGYVPGRYIDPDKEISWKENLAKSSLGKTHTCSVEHRQAISEAQHGTKCYTDGVSTIKLKPGEPIPEGFILGRTSTEAQKQSTKKAQEANRGRVCSEYVKQRSREAHLGQVPVNAKKVFCIETNTLYTSISGASKGTTVPASYIQKALKKQIEAEIYYKGSFYNFKLIED